MVGTAVRKLILTLHDVSPAHEDTVRKIHSILQQLGAFEYSMLVIPDHHGEWPLDQFPEFCKWLKNISQNGVEIVQHGFQHKAGTVEPGLINSFRSMLFTRNEGEFLGLDETAAEKLIISGRQILDRTLGIDIKGFVAPAWLYSRGTARALKKTGFAFTESRYRIWDPRSRSTILAAPIANYAGGSSLKRYLAALWVGLSGYLFARAETVRFAVHPYDFETGSVENTVIERLRKLLEKRETVSFRDLLPAP